jgi:hypothetical protein
MGRGQSSANANAGKLLYTFNRSPNAGQTRSSTGVLDILATAFQIGRFSEPELRSIVRSASYRGPVDGNAENLVETWIGHVDAVASEGSLQWSVRLSGQKSGDIPLWQGTDIHRAVGLLNRSLRATQVNGNNPHNPDFGPEQIRAQGVVRAVEQLLQLGRDRFDAERDRVVRYPLDEWARGRAKHPALIGDLADCEPLEIGQRLAARTISTETALFWVLQPAVFSELQLTQRERWRREQLADQVGRALVEDSLSTVALSTVTPCSGWWRSEFDSTWAAVDRQHRSDQQVSEERRQAFTDHLSLLLGQQLCDELARGLVAGQSAVAGQVIELGRHTLSQQMATWLVGNDERIAGWLPGQVQRHLAGYGKHLLGRNRNLAKILSYDMLREALYHAEAGGDWVDKWKRVEFSLEAALLAAS